MFFTNFSFFRNSKNIQKNFNKRSVPSRLIFDPFAAVDPRADHIYSTFFGVRNIIFNAIYEHKNARRKFHYTVTVRREFSPSAL